MDINTAIFFGVLTFLTVAFTVIKLPLWASLFVVRHPVITDVIFNVFMASIMILSPTLAVIGISIIATLTVAGMLYANTKYRWMERALLSKAQGLISQCEHAEVIARSQKEYDAAINKRQDYQWTVCELHQAIKEVRG